MDEGVAMRGVARGGQQEAAGGVVSLCLLHIRAKHTTRHIRHTHMSIMESHM